MCVSSSRGIYFPKKNHILPPPPLSKMILLSAQVGAVYILGGNISFLFPFIIFFPQVLKMIFPLGKYLSLVWSPGPPFASHLWTNLRMILRSDSTSGHRCLDFRNIFNFSLYTIHSSLISQVSIPNLIVDIVNSDNVSTTFYSQIVFKGNQSKS